jgi:drug/metabolite transporter (DMT)-like permease
MIERVWGLIFVIGAVAAESAAHLAFKRAADSGRYSRTAWSSLRMVMGQHGWVTGGVLCIVAQIWSWTLALKRLDVSLAYPLGDLELIVIMVLCRLILKETIGSRRWAGIVLIFVGAVMVALS